MRHTHASGVGSSAMVDIVFFRRLYCQESFDTFVDDNSEPSTARVTSDKCEEVGMARKRVSAHLRSAWQQKPGVIHRYAKDTILKNLFPPVLLRIICISVCELKKSQLSTLHNDAHSYDLETRTLKVREAAKIDLCRKDKYFHFSQSRTRKERFL